jgi:hypothetical protein
VAISATGICRFEQGAGGLYLFGGVFSGATSVATAGARRLETGDGSFTDQVALELREGGEKVQDQPARPEQWRSTQRHGSGCLFQ